jgi:hypothetical protein
VAVVANGGRPRKPAELIRARGVDVVRHEEIEVSVSIDVDKGAARAPQRSASPAGVGHFGKSPAAGIAIQGVRTDVGDVEIDEPVVVDVAGAGPHPVLAMLDSGLIGDVFKLRKP